MIWRLGGLKARRLAGLEARRSSLLGCSWGFLECSWRAPGLLLGTLAFLFVILGWFRDVLRCSWDGLTMLRGSRGVVLECPWGLLECFWDVLRASWGALGVLLGPLGVLWGCLGVLLGCRWGPLGIS